MSPNKITAYKLIDTSDCADIDLPSYEFILTKIFSFQLKYSSILRDVQF